MAHWEYRVTCYDDDIEAVDKQMHEWAAHGWELVSGSTSTWVHRESSDGFPVDIYHTRYATFWRRERANP
jgi:hypothetical protein